MEIKNKTRTEKIKVFIVDDHPIVREGIAQLLSKEKNIIVCGEASNAYDGFEKIGKTLPDVAIINLSMPGKNGLELIRDIRFAYPNVSNLVFSMHDEMIYAERALKAGARGYVMKTEGVEKLIEAIYKVSRGEIAVSPRVSNEIISNISSKNQKTINNPTQLLSNREFEIFQLIGKGLGIRQIAEQLHISIKTVESYRSSIKEKLKIKSTEELVHYAVSWCQAEFFGIK
ncbi:LuxR family transcriptional regulator [Methylacidiphilum kamchatkense Kam1]|uniref:LuxR family transcriptional regulator n=1 Tax=Methylacidiphilum kamchatkense Kam1 TaxID=1202785 RepID=A0A0C1UQB1_9BACT|nr:response regulator transcription factor [Methylacidiphilum kamchatkense]KIE58043.1 LuxR family transcriptional regulator [Methylacidiphilum kamchatkense Kam1]QDQ41649.1 LuxR family two component transcriptional regulator [Methylacidiphilum kamchatkense Kam1]